MIRCHLCSFGSFTVSSFRIMESNTIVAGLQETKTFLTTLHANIICRQDVLTWFQNLCNKLCSLLLKIAENIKRNENPIYKNKKETILLYLLQLNTTLSVLIKLFAVENDVRIALKESRCSILHLINMCLCGLEDIFNMKVMSNDTAIGFTKYMDLALDRVTEIDAERSSDLVWNSTEHSRLVIEEVLCHAMSIAQMSLHSDCNAIKGSSKEVLLNLDYLFNELQKQTPSISMCNLFIDATCDKLCALERKVNTAVLKLSLKIFSECTKPLELLYQLCLKQQCDESELDEAVADFDLHVDRIIQVGLFAVSCSTDRSCTLKMRNCLASLEALETELVPAMLALHKNGGTTHNLHHTNLLQQFWIRQATDLKKCIYLIIDPFAFCQITHEVIRDINAELEERLHDTTELDKKYVKPITLQTKILHEMLLASVTDHPPEKIIRKYLEDVIKVTSEIDAAADKLLREREVCKENVARVFKRCRILENVLRQLLHAMGKVADPIDPGLHTTDSSFSCDDPVRGGITMKHIASRGHQILKDRSVLYKTPATSSRAIAALKDSTEFMPRLAHLRHIQFSHSRSTEGASVCDLQITDILNNLTALSTSFQS